MLYRTLHITSLDHLREIVSAVNKAETLWHCIESVSLHDGTFKSSSLIFTCRFVNLRALELAYVHISKMDNQFRQAVRSVKTLRLVGVTFESQKCVARFSSFFGNLRELSVQHTFRQDTAVMMLGILGNKLTSFSAKAVYLTDIDRILRLLPRVTVLTLQSNSSSAWRVLSPRAIPATCEHLDVRVWDAQFVRALLAEFRQADYLPNLKSFPSIAWVPGTGAQRHIMETSAFKALKIAVLDIMQERGLDWRSMNLAGTIFYSVQSPRLC